MILCLYARSYDSRAQIIQKKMIDAKVDCYLVETNPPKDAKEDSSNLPITLTVLEEINDFSAIVKFLETINKKETVLETKSSKSEKSVGKIDIKDVKEDEDYLVFTKDPFICMGCFEAVYNSELNTLVAVYWPHEIDLDKEYDKIIKIIRVKSGFCMPSMNPKSMLDVSPDKNDEYNVYCSCGWHSCAKNNQDAYDDYRGHVCT